jgi:hypothetical protein
MNKLSLIKAVGGFVVSAGVSAIIQNVIKSTTPSSISIYKKVCIVTGAIVLSKMCSDKAVEYADSKIDKTVDQLKKIVTNGDLD